MAETPKLTYLAGRGWAEVTRLIFAVLDIEIQEDYIRTREEFEKLMATGKLMFNQLPLLEMDGLCVVESYAIPNYLGRRYNMLGTTNEEQARVQMLFAGIKAFDAICGPYWTFQPAEKRPDLIKRAINESKNRYLPVLEKVFKENGTGFLVGNSPTIADCALFHDISFFDEMPEYGDLLDGYPYCKAFLTKFSEIPGVKKYLNSPRRFPVPDDEHTAEVQAALHI